MQLRSRLKDEFAFLRGNMLVLMASWLLMNFAGAIPSTYYSLYILELDGTPFIIGILDFIAFIAIELVQFPGGYLADKHGRRAIIVTFTFGAWKVAGTVKDFHADRYLSLKEMKRLDSFAHYAIAASVMAAEDASLSGSDLLRPAGVIIGSSRGGISAI